MRQLASGNVPSRVKKLLKDTISVMCRSSLQYDMEVAVEGLIGITLDKRDIFLVNINELIRNDDAHPVEDTSNIREADSSRVQAEDNYTLLSSGDESLVYEGLSTSKRKRRRRSRDQSRMDMTSSVNVGNATPFHQVIGELTSSNRKEPSHSLGAPPTELPLKLPHQSASEPIHMDLDDISVKREPGLGPLELSPDPVPVNIIPTAQFHNASGEISPHPPPHPLPNMDGLPMYSTPSADQNTVQPMAETPNTEVRQPLLFSRSSRSS